MFYAAHDKNKQEDGFEIDPYAKAGGILVRCVARPEKTRFIKTGITQKRFAVLYHEAKAAILEEIEKEKMSVNTNKPNKETGNEND